MNIYIGNDHAGLQMKKEIVTVFADEGQTFIDCGTNTEAGVDYPDIALLVTGKVQKESALGILICGTGIGMSMAANKAAGIRAALCQDPVTARLAREHNDANILVLGARIIGPVLAVETVRAFLAGKFAGGRHRQRIEKITFMEKM